MLLGVCYYPEHWPRERWEVDAKLMREAGIRRMRIGEFAWHRMEPKEGRFDFDWLREAMDLFGRYGVETILCTPTPTYPAWLHAMYLDIHQLCSDGRAKEWGQRNDACKLHPGYREHARRIVHEMTQALGEHPRVVAWQTDNEFGNHRTTRCYCEYCRRAFQEWLRRRFHDDIAALNAAWGTFFWSTDYNDFSEIVTPMDTANRPGSEGHNPALVLDFDRFSSDVVVGFQREQVAMIRRHSPGRLVTHNLMGPYPDTNYFHLAEDLDVVSWDNYPFDANGTNKPPSPLAHDLMRGTKQRNVWIMEQASGPGGWGYFLSTPQPGQMRLWSWQSVARGADMVSYFRWRSCRWGREQYWHGILFHHGKPQRRYDEVKQLGAEFTRVADELKDTTVEAKVAILYDYDTLWVLESQPNAKEGFDYRKMMGAYDRTLARLGVTADVVGPDADLSRYNVLIAPTIHVCGAALTEKLEQFVRAGGTLLMGPRSGVKDEENAVFDDLLPGPLRPLAGCWVEEYDTFGNVPGLEMRVRNDAGTEYPVTAIADVLVPDKGARVLLTYAAHYYAGKAAVVQHDFGKGTCLYIGAVPDETLIVDLIEPLLDKYNIPQHIDLPEAVETTCRVRGDQRYTFYLNHGANPVSVAVSRPGVDILTGKSVKGALTLPRFEVAIIKEKAERPAKARPTAARRPKSRRK